MTERSDQTINGGWAGRPPVHGLMLLADITGYTDYLKGSELAHAENVVADLADVIVKSLTPVFHKSKLEGDAVFSYALSDTVDGSIVLDVVEETYFAFRRRVRDVDLATTCQCNACRLIPTLDLKFIVHSGEFVIGEMVGSEELTGTDVVTVHRLLKNTVREELGFDAYALLTEACVDTFGMNPTTLGLVEHTDIYEDIGAITSYVEDLTERWQFEEERHQVFVTPANAELEMVWETNASVPVMWDYLNSPQKRLLWQSDFETIDQENPSGLMGVGTTNHCKHGKGEITEEILDWKPYRYFTVMVKVPMIGGVTFTYEFRDRDGGGSQALMRAERLRGLKKLMFMPMRPMMKRNIDRNRTQLAALLANKEPLPDS